MFSALITRVNIALSHLVIHATQSVATPPRLHTFALNLSKVSGFALAITALASPPANCNDNVLGPLITGVNHLVGILVGLGIAAGVIGIAVGGLMRATSFGNERRIAMSNTAITCAVVGLVIVILAVTVGNNLPSWLGQAGGGSCKVQ